MFFNIEKSDETTFEFTKNATAVVWFWPCIKLDTQKIVNLSGEVDNESSKFATRKWYVINDQNNTDYGEGNESGTTVKFETKVIKSNLCDYSDAYILVTRDITVKGGNADTGEKTNKQIIAMGRNNYYTTGNLLEYEYFSKHYKLTAIAFRNWIELENPDLKQQINFIGKRERNERATMLFNIEKSDETTFEFTKNVTTVVWFWPCIKMDTQKIVNLSGEVDNESSKFATGKWYVINDQNNTDYDEGNESGTTVKFKTKVIKSSLCDYSDAYILVTGDITAKSSDADTRVAFKNCAPFTKCITLNH